MEEFREIERMVNQTLWYAIMYEPYQGEKYFENDTFIVRPFSWEGEVWDSNIKYDEKYSHDNSWHFWHKPSGLKIQWYKYPLRGIEANMDITNEQFYAVLQDCMNSTDERRRPGDSITFVDSTFKSWWNDSRR